MLFRPVRETLKEAMENAIEFDGSKRGLTEAVQKSLKSTLKITGESISEEELNTKYLKYDERIDWETYRVTCNGYAVGYANGMPKP